MADPNDCLIDMVDRLCTTVNDRTYQILRRALPMEARDLRHSELRTRLVCEQRSDKSQVFRLDDIPILLLKAPHFVMLADADKIQSTLRCDLDYVINPGKDLL